MAPRIGEDDRRAVDTLLDHNQVAPSKNKGNGGAGKNPTVATQNTFQQRVVAVERLLQLLDHMPATEPPADLASKTLRRLDEAIMAAAEATRGVQPPLDIRPLI